MRVQVFKLRARGKHLSKDELRQCSPLEGDLELVKYQSDSRLYSYAKVCIQHGGGRIDVLCHLYEPKLVSIEGDSLLFDGVEKDLSGEMFFQQWRCFV